MTKYKKGRKGKEDGKQQSDLPFGDEFSPCQIDLAALLEVVQANTGDPHAVEAVILQRYFSDYAEGRTDADNAYNRAKLANNCKLGLINYGIIDRRGYSTLSDRTLQPPQGGGHTTALARHILRQVVTTGARSNEHGRLSIHRRERTLE